MLFIAVEAKARWKQETLFLRELLLGKIRGGVAVEAVRAGMRQFAVEVEPDLAADGAPTAAESVILAEIHAGVLVDHAIIEDVEILARLGRAQIQPFRSPG